MNIAHSLFFPLLIAFPIWAADPEFIRDASSEELPPGAVARFGSTRLHGRSYIDAVAFSRDGKRLAWASEAGQVSISEAATGRTLLDIQPFPGTGSPITELAFSPDGRLLAASGYWMTEIRVLDLEARRLIRAIPNTAENQQRRARRWQGAGFAFTPDGKSLAVAGKDGAFRVFDIETGKERFALAQTKEVALNLALSADGKTAFTAHHGGELHLWSVADRKHLQKLEATAKFPHFTAFAPDGKTVALAVGDKELELHDPAKGLLSKITTKALVYGLGFNAAGDRVLVAESNGQVSTWDAPSGKELRRLQTCEALPEFPNLRQGSMVWARFRPDGNVVAWGQVSTLGAFDLKTGKEATSLPALRKGISTAKFSPDGKLLVLGGSQSGELAVWKWAQDLQVGPTRRTGQRESVRFAFGSDLRKVAVTSFPMISNPSESDRGARVLIWDAAANAEPVEFRGVKPAWSAVFTPDYRYLVTSEIDGQIRVYDPASGAAVRSFAGPKDGYPLTFSPDGSRLAVRTPDFSLRVYRFRAGDLAVELKLPGGLMSLAFSPDGKLIITGHSMDFNIGNEQGTTGNMICVWDATSGAKMREIASGQQHVNGVAFSSDGRLLASCDMKGSVRLWEVASGQMRRECKGHKNWVNSVDFAPDGRHLASASNDGTAIVWSVYDKPPALNLDAAWADLAQSGEKAHAAIAALAADKGAAEFLAARLKPATPANAEQIQKWLADLGSSQFTTREAAQKNLARAAELAEADLRNALTKAADAELRRRLTALVDNLPRKELRAEALRELRAIEALELAATSEARKLLEMLAKGAPTAALTQQADASLKRMPKQ